MRSNLSSAHFSPYCDPHDVRQLQRGWGSTLRPCTNSSSKVYSRNYIHPLSSRGMARSFSLNYPTEWRRGGCRQMMTVGCSLNNHCWYEEKIQIIVRIAYWLEPVIWFCAYGAKSSGCGYLWSTILQLLLSLARSSRRMFLFFSPIGPPARKNC